MVGSGRAPEVPETPTDGLGGPPGGSRSPQGPDQKTQKHILLAGPNVKVSLKFRRVPLDLRFGTRIDPPRSRNQGFDLNFSAPEGRGKGLDPI